MAKGVIVSTDRSEVLQGTLDLLILKTLYALGPLHGFGVARRIEQVSEDVLKLNEGTVPLRLRRQVCGILLPGRVLLHGGASARRRFLWDRARWTASWGDEPGNPLECKPFSVLPFRCLRRQWLRWCTCTS